MCIGVIIDSIHNKKSDDESKCDKEKSDKELFLKYFKRGCKKTV